MTNFGIVRNMDALWRIVISKAFRQVFELKRNEPVEMLATDQGILLRRPNIEVRSRSINAEEVN